MRAIARKPRLVTVGRCLAAVVVLTASASDAPAKERTWLRVSSEHVVVYTDGSPFVAQWIVKAVDALQPILRDEPFGKGIDEIPPLEFVIFERTKDYRKFDGERSLRPTLVGYYMWRPFATVVALDASVSPYRSTIHEYLHHVERYSGWALPRWFEEGLADYYSSLVPIEGGWAVGALPKVYEEYWYPKAIHTWETLASGDTAPESYATCWALVHFLMTERPRATLVAFLEALERGTPAEDAVRSVLDLEPETFERKIANYRTEGRFPWRTHDAADEARWETRPARPSEIAARKALLLSNLTERDRRSVKKWATIALGDDRERGLAYASLAWAADREGQKATAVDFARRAVEAAPDAPGYRILTSLVLLPGWEKTRKLPDSTPDAVVEARDHARRALESIPHDYWALRAYGSTWLFDPGDPAPGLTTLTEAIHAHPDDSITRAMRARILLLHGRRDEAWASVAEGSPPAEVKERVERSVVGWESDGVSALIRGGKKAEAVALARDLAARTSIPDIRNLILRWCEEQEKPPTPAASSAPRSGGD